MEETLIALEKERERLVAEHRNIDCEINTLSKDSVGNVFVLQQKKRLKLKIRDEIARIESQLYPDIIA